MKWSCNNPRIPCGLYALIARSISRPLQSPGCHLRVRVAATNSHTAQNPDVNRVSCNLRCIPRSVFAKFQTLIPLLRSC